MLSIHFVVDNCPPDRLERGLQYLKRVNATSCDIAAGAELLKGMQFAERVRIELPDITIIWRNLDPDDTGAHTKMSAASLYARKVKPYLGWFQKNRIVFMPDNESGGSDEHMKTVFVPWVVEFLVLLHADKLNGAVLRSSTGTYPEHQYALLRPVFAAMLSGDYVSPNEYSAQPGYPKGSGGHLARYKHLWEAAGRKLPTIIGEAGIAMNYDPGKGYIDAGMTDEAMAQQMINEEMWYEDGEIDRHAYLLGGFSHEGYRLRDGVLDYWERYYANKQPPIVVKPPTLPPPPPETFPPPPPVRWVPALTSLRHGAGIVNLRSTPNIAARDLGDIRNGDSIAYDAVGVEGGWWHVKVGQTIGYVSAEYFSPLPQELPAPNPAETDLKRLVVIEAQIQALRAERASIIGKYATLAKIA